MILRSGKYKGKTISWVKDNDLRYLMWVKENRPEMLKEINKKEVKTEKSEKPDTIKSGGIPRNENFYDECVDETSIPYMVKFPDKYADELLRFKNENKKKFRLIMKDINNNG